MLGVGFGNHYLYKAVDCVGPFCSVRSAGNQDVPETRRLGGPLEQRRAAGGVPATFHSVFDTTVRV